MKAIKNNNNNTNSNIRPFFLQPWWTVPTKSISFWLHFYFDRPAVRNAGWNKLHKHELWNKHETHCDQRKDGREEKREQLVTQSLKPVVWVSSSHMRTWESPLVFTSCQVFPRLFFLFAADLCKESPGHKPNSSGLLHPLLLASRFRAWSRTNRLFHCTSFSKQNKIFNNKKRSLMRQFMVLSDGRQGSTCGTRTWKDQRGSDGYQNTEKGIYSSAQYRVGY